MDRAGQLSPPRKRQHGKVTIRPMATEDAAAVAQMARELAAALSDPEPALDAQKLVRDGTGPGRWFDCLVAVVDGRAVGYAMCCRGYEAHIGKRRLWLSDLYVRADARKRGAGRALMAAVARLAVAQNCDALCWDLWRENAAGRAFYQSLGAVEAGDLTIWSVASRNLAPIDGGSP
jgi:GNAT superfamily N-acetyltransferase